MQLSSGVASAVAAGAATSHSESVNVASYALVRDGICVRVCVFCVGGNRCIGSPRARRPLVVWFRFAASRLGRSRGAVYLSHRLVRVRLSVRRGFGLLVLVAFTTGAEAAYRYTRCGRR